MENKNINLMSKESLENSEINPLIKTGEGIPHDSLILQKPVEHSLYEIFQQLKFGRPTESQLFLQKCIDMLDNHPINQVHERGIQHMYRIRKGSIIKVASLPVEVLEDFIVESSMDIMKTESNFLGSIVLEKLINEEFIQQYPIAIK